MHICSTRGRWVNEVEKWYRTVRNIHVLSTRNSGTINHHLPDHTWPETLVRKLIRCCIVYILLNSYADWADLINMLYAARVYDTLYHVAADNAVEKLIPYQTWKCFMYLGISRQNVDLQCPEFPVTSWSQSKLISLFWQNIILYINL